MARDETDTVFDFSDLSGGRSLAPVGSASTVEALRQTKPWVRFLSVLGFITGGLMVAAGGVMIPLGIVGGIEFAGLGAMYVFGGVIFYLIPCGYLFRYANRIRDFVAQRNQEHLDGALAAQRSFWRFVGILALVTLCLYAVVGLVLTVVAVAGGLRATP